MTTTRKWTAGAALVAVLVLVAGWFLLVAPKQSEASDLKTQAQTQEDTNATLQTQIATLKQEYKSLPEQQAQLAKLHEQIPQTGQMPTYVTQLIAAADRSGVKLKTMTPQDPATLGTAALGVTTTTTPLSPDSLAGQNVDVEVEGSYFEIMKFESELETLQRYVLVTGVTVAELEDTGSTTTTAAPTNKVLTGTFNTRVFLVPAAPTTEVVQPPGTVAAPTTAPTTAPSTATSPSPAASAAPAS
jgi:Tfp pilus assembly protein PilO